MDSEPINVQKLLYIMRLASCLNQKLPTDFADEAKIWIHCLYLMSLNQSNRQIALELDLNKSDVQKMTQQLRTSVCNKHPVTVLDGKVECDEVYVVSGHKGQPEAVKKKGGQPAVTV